jgi:hypothetical protein
MNIGGKVGDSQVSEPATCGEPAASEGEASPAKRTRPPSPHNCRNFIRRQTANAMPAIVSAFVESAKKGSVPHFASLAKVGGFDQRTGAAEASKRKRRSLARQLLDEVERYEADQAAERAAAEAQATHIDNPNGRPQERS